MGVNCKHTAIVLMTVLMSCQSKQQKNVSTESDSIDDSIKVSDIVDFGHSDILNYHLDSLLNVYISDIGEIENEKQRETIYSISLTGDTVNAEVSISACQYLSEPIMEAYGIIGLGMHKSTLISISDYDNSLFNNWYNAEELSLENLDDYLLLDADWETELPPLWRFRIDEEGTHLIEKSDTLRFI